MLCAGLQFFKGIRVFAVGILPYGLFFAQKRLLLVLEVEERKKIRTYLSDKYIRNGGNYEKFIKLYT